MDSDSAAIEIQIEVMCDDGGEEPEQQMTMDVDSNSSGGTTVTVPSSISATAAEDTEKGEDKVLEKSDPEFDLIGENMEVTSEMCTVEQEQNSLGSSCSSSSDDDMKVVTKDEGDEKDEKISNCSDAKSSDCSDEKASNCSDEKPAAESPVPRSKYSLRTRRARNNSMDSTSSFSSSTRRRRKFFFFHDDMHDPSVDKRKVVRPRKDTTSQVVTSSHVAVAAKELIEKPKEGQDGVSFKCTHCERSYSRRRDLKQHVVSHTSDACKCLICSKTFTTVKGTKQHMREQHSDSKIFNCPRCCIFTSLSEEGLRHHLVQSHNETFMKPIKRSGGGFQGSKRKVLKLRETRGQDHEERTPVSNKSSPRRSSRVAKVKKSYVAASVETCPSDRALVEDEQSRGSWCTQEFQNSSLLFTANSSIFSSRSTCQSFSHQNGPGRELDDSALGRFAINRAGPARLRCERCDRSFFMQRMLDRHLCLDKRDSNAGKIQKLEFNPFSLTISGCNVRQVNTRQKARRASVGDSILTTCSSSAATAASTKQASPLATPNIDENPLPIASCSTAQKTSEIAYKCRQCQLEFPRPMLLVIHEHCVHRRAAKNGRKATSKRNGTLARKNGSRRDKISCGDRSPLNQSASGSPSRPSLSVNCDGKTEGDGANCGNGKKKLTKVVIYLGT